MTTRINGQPIHRHTLPSYGERNSATRPSSTCRNLTLLDKWSFEILDKYLSTEPGSPKAAKTVRKLKRN